MRDVMKLVRMNLLKLGSLGKTLWLYLVVILLFVMSDTVMIMSSAVFLYMALYTVAAYDEQSKGNCLIGSLPLSRVQVVQANYIYVLLALAVSTALVAVTMRLLTLVGLRERTLSPQSVQLVFFVGAVFTAIAQPLILYLGASRARWVMLGLYCLGFGFSGAAASLSQTAPGTLGLPGAASFAPVLIPVGMGLLVISYLMAVRLYLRREFAD